jgi:membrane-associated phospholipid phosphatase
VRIAVVLVCLLAADAHADEVLKPIARQRWYEGPHGKNRLLHFSITTVGFVAYPLFDFVEHGVECRWCGGPNAFDRAVRDALVWGDFNTAAQLSDVTSYVLSPALDMGLVLAGTLATPSTAALMDDLIPIAESMVITQWVTRGIKVTVARTRPFAALTDASGSEENLSFPSGHTSRAFALATSAGVIAHTRGYKIEPFVWAGGMTLAATSAYLRIAADRHYVTDVLVGAALGVAGGLTVPLLMRRTNVELVPTRTGIAAIGVW